MQDTPQTKDYSKAASDEQIKTVQSALEANGFKVKVVNDLDELKDTVKGLIPKGAEIFTAASETLRLSGLDKELNDSGDYASARNNFMALAGQEDKAIEMRRMGSASDYAIGSVHGITQDGQVVIASASGSQLPNYVYGANNFIWAVGSQKIVKDLDEAFDRLENYTFPLEDARALQAYGANSSLNKILIYRKETKGRGTVIIIKQPVGY